jgi:hypothetical protein
MTISIIYISPKFHIIPPKDTGVMTIFLLIQFTSITLYKGTPDPSFHI